MIHIEYVLKPSTKHGVGLFAGQDISSGDLVYSPSPLLDTDLTCEEFATLSQEEQREVLYYGYFHKPTQKYHVAFDAIRVLNHGDAPESNVTQDESMMLRAKRDIKKGEELLQDYRELFPEGDDHFMRINHSTNETF